MDVSRLRNVRNSEKCNNMPYTITRTNQDLLKNKQQPPSTFRVHLLTHYFARKADILFPLFSPQRDFILHANYIEPRLLPHTEYCVVGGIIGYSCAEKPCAGVNSHLASSTVTLDVAEGSKTSQLIGLSKRHQPCLTRGTACSDFREHDQHKDAGIPSGKPRLITDTEQQ